MSSIPFITYTDAGYKISQESQDFFQSLNPKIKLSVICIVGKYRTGKSYFVNKVLLDKRQAFKVGSTVNACTKGLWLYTDTIEVEEDHHLLIVDTEGLGSTDVNKHQDSMIVLLALLVSSYFIYNSVGTLDEFSLNDLGLILSLAKNLDSKFVFPEFLWVVRDFALQLINQEGDQLKPKAYLEKLLQLQKGMSEQIQKKNDLRKMFKDMFQKRDCALLVRPIENEENLQQLDTLEDSELRPEFLQQVDKLRTKIYKNAPVKKLNSLELNGSLFLAACFQYCDAINAGGVPTVRNTWSYVTKYQAQDLLNKLTRTIDQQVISQSQIKSELTTYLGKGELKQLQDQLTLTFLARLKSEIMDDTLDLKDIQLELAKKIKTSLKQHNSYLYDSHLGSIKKKIEPQMNTIKALVNSEGYDTLEEFQTAIDTLQKDAQGEMGEEIKNLQIKGYQVLLKYTQSYSHQITSLKEQISYQQEREDNIKQENEQQISLLTQKFNNKQQEYIKQSKETEDMQHQKIQTHQSEIQKLNDFILQLQEEHQLLLEQNQQTKQKSAVSSETLNQLNQEIHHLMEDKAQLLEEMKDQQQMEHTSRKLLTDLNEEYDMLQKEHSVVLESFQNYTQEASQNIQNLQDIIEQQTQDIEHLTRKLHNAEKERNMVQTENQQKLIDLQKELIKLNSDYLDKINANNKIVGQEQIFNQELKLKNSQQQEKINFLQQQLKDNKKMFESNQSLLHNLAQTNQNLVSSGFKRTQQETSLMVVTIPLMETYKHNDKIYNKYHVQIDYSAKSWRVIKFYEDFIQLHQILKQRFPNIDLPEKSTQNFNNQYVMNATKKSMELYMEELVNIIEIKDCKEFRAFIQFEKQNAIPQLSNFKRIVSRPPSAEKQYSNSRQRCISYSNGKEFLLHQNVKVRAFSGSKDKQQVYTEIPSDLQTTRKLIFDNKNESPQNV